MLGSRIPIIGKSNVYGAKAPDSGAPDIAAQYAAMKASQMADAELLIYCRVLTLENDVRCSCQKLYLYCERVIFKGNSEFIIKNVPINGR